MKITVFAGSNSSASINKKTVTWVASLFAEDKVEILDLNDYEMPIYKMDREVRDGIPQLAHDFAKKIDDCDLLIISLAEHNGAYTTAFKNIFDWVSRIKGRKAFGGKPMFLMAVSDGGRGAASVLDIASKRMPFSGGNVLETFSLPKFYENFNETSGVTEPELRAALLEKVESVKKKAGELMKS